MRILMVNKYGPEVCGGIEMQAHRLAQAMAQTGQVAVEFLVVAGSKDKRTITEKQHSSGYTQVTVPLTCKLGSTPYARQLTPEFTQRAHSADIIHLHYPYPFADWSLNRAYQKYPELRKKPLIISFHSDIVRQKKALALYNSLRNRTFQAADAIAVSSPNLKNTAEQLQGFRDKCHVVHFGVDAQFFSPESVASEKIAALREEMHIPAQAPVILFVGRFVYYKGIEVLLQAVALMRNQGAHLVLIGSGPLEKKMRALTVRLNIADVVHFAGSVSDEDLVAWYNTAHMLVLPSTHNSEAFGIVQIEAHACGVPTIVSNLSTGVTYATLDKVDGLHVPVGNAAELSRAMDQLIDDPALRAQLSAQARHRVLDEFTPEHAAAQMIELYSKLLEDS